MARMKFELRSKYIPVSGKVYDKDEINNIIAAANDGWWTEGRFAKQFEKDFKSFLNAKYVSLVNSGSSANLLALSSLTSSIFGEKALHEGDEVITCATAFPTTVNPIIQNRCIPVIVDADLNTKNPSPLSIKKAITKKTKAIMLAHTLGNPFPIKEVLSLAKKSNLWVIEDACDALGSKYQNKCVGIFGDIATFSFYPAHQITMGEGGAVITNNPLIHRSIRQFRDWGRDCWCGTGTDNTCHKRFAWKLGDLPSGYDHKYIYSQIGYNLKLTDFQAAIGVAQLKKLPYFIEIRKRNFDILFQFFQKYKQFFILPQVCKNSEPCWFGFMLVIKENAPFSRLDIVKYLEDNNIGTRTLFGGNLMRHPAYRNRKDIRIVGLLENSDKIMNNGFWIGVFPGITEEMLIYVKKILSEFIKLVENRK
jgi:CDP-4-dehydro-6-deoxyglucose reductase, E1